MHEFQCGSPVCHSRISSPSKETLMREVARHVREVHRIPEPTKSILEYLERTAVRDNTGAVRR
jgi:predicted small metal-binding protein